MVMSIVGGRLPSVPDPTVVAKSGADVAKAIATGGLSVGMDIAEGVRKVLFQSVEGGVGVMYEGVKGIVNIARVNVDTGKSTMESIRRDIDQAANSVLSQVDQAVGGEVVRKFKSEVERQLR